MADLNSISLSIFWSHQQNAGFKNKSSREDVWNLNNEWIFYDLDPGSIKNLNVLKNINIFLMYNKTM